MLGPLLVIQPLLQLFQILILSQKSQFLRAEGCQCPHSEAPTTITITNTESRETITAAGKSISLFLGIGTVHSALIAYLRSMVPSSTSVVGVDIISKPQKTSHSQNFAYSFFIIPEVYFWYKTFSLNFRPLFRPTYSQPRESLSSLPLHHH